MGQLEAFIIITLIVAVVVALVWLLVAWNFGKKMDQAKNTRGLNALNGTQLNLTCPVGKKISINAARYICIGTDTVGNLVCDPMNADGTFSDSTTADATADLAQCNGLQKCTVTVNGDLSNQCSGGNNTATCSNIAVSGVYDCIPV
jgi:hypothetical protein